MGFPLGLMLASKRNFIYLYDKNKDVCSKINKGEVPYFESGAKKILKKYKNNLLAGNDHRYIAESNIIIVSIGTPIYKKRKPQLKKFLNLFYFLKKVVNKKQVIIITCLLIIIILAY